MGAASTCTEAIVNMKRADIHEHEERGASKYLGISFHAQSSKSTPNFLTLVHVGTPTVYMLSEGRAFTKKKILVGNLGAQQDAVNM